MNRSLYVAATGMRAQQTKLDVISNNLANVNTTGFKRGRADFEDLLYQSLRPVGASATANTEVPTGIYLGHGSRCVSTSKIFNQGSARFTDVWHDIAIEGEGFFQIEMPDGTTAYTRDGSFKIRNDGMMVTANGNPLIPNIAIPENAIKDSVSVGLDGIVTYKTPGAVDSVQLGPIQLAKFINPQGLHSVGSNLFTETTSSGPPTLGTPDTQGFGQTVGGTLEMSNVDMVEELVSMIIGQRAYEINSKAITTADQMLETAVNVKR